MSSRTPEWSTSEGHSGIALATAYHTAQQHPHHIQQQRFSSHPPQHVSLSASSLPGNGQQQRLHVSPTPLSSHYYYASASPGQTGASMNHQQQPRQPPSLNIAAAAAVPVVSSFHSMALSDNQSHPTPYSAPANASSSFYNNGNVGGQPYSSHGHAASYNGQMHQPVHHGSSSANGVPFMMPNSQVNNATNLGHTSAYGNVNGQSHHQSSSGSYGYRFGANGPADFTSGMASHSGHYDAHPGHSMSPIEANILGENDFDGDHLGSLKVKRKQVKNACVNCQKACKRCDEGRPCSRCVKYGLTATCTDSARKERKRGIKRGPYKRRATTGSQSVHFSHHQASSSGNNGTHHLIASSSANSSLAPMSSALMNGHEFSGTSSFANSLGAHQSSSSPMSPPIRTYYNGDNTAVAASSFELSGQSQSDSNAPQYATVSQRSHTAAAMPGSTAVSYDVNGNNPNSATTATYTRENSYLNGVLGSNQYGVSTMPPPGAARSLGRQEYDISGGTHNFASSLYSNVPAVHQVTNRSLSTQPGSAPAASTNFIVNSNVQAGLPLPHRSGFASHVFSPGATGSSPSSAQSNMLLGSTQNGMGNSGNSSNNSSSSRLFSDSNLATMSNGSGTTTSTSHSPRTPGVTGAGMMGVSEMSLGNGHSLPSTSSPGASVKPVVNASNGGQANSYLHHPRSSTLTALSSSSAGAFFNAQAGHPFSLHLPHSARFRGSVMNAHVSSSSSMDPNRPRSGQSQAEEQYEESSMNSDENTAQRALPVLNQTSENGTEKSEWQTPGYSTNNARYQLPSPRMSSGEGRTRPLMS